MWSVISCWFLMYLCCTFSFCKDKNNALSSIATAGLECWIWYRSAEWVFEPLYAPMACCCKQSLNVAQWMQCCYIFDNVSPCWTVKQEFASHIPHITVKQGQRSEGLLYVAEMLLFVKKKTLSVGLFLHICVHDISVTRHDGFARGFL